MSKLSRSVRTLNANITTQDGGLKLLFQKAAVLEANFERSRSQTVKNAVLELLAVGVPSRRAETRSFVPPT